MREDFARRLETHKKFAREVVDGSSQDTQVLDQIIDLELEQLAHEARTSVEVQRVVFHLQQDKQRIMAILHQQLRGEEPQDTLEAQANRQRFVRFTDGKLIWQRHDGETFEITPGELLTAGEWGVHYQLDAQSVPLPVRKRYFAREARRAIWKLLQRQIALEESQKMPKAVGAAKRRQSLPATQKQSQPMKPLGEIFQAALQRLETGEESAGFIGERMVRTWLEKCAIEYDLPILVEDSDVYNDVIQMVDFQIRPIGRESHARPLGIQFSTMDDHVPATKEKLERKRKRLEKYKDITCRELGLSDLILVNVSGRYQAHYNKWVHEKKPVGGPDRSWPPEFRLSLLRPLLEPVLSNRQFRELESRMQKDGLLPDTRRTGR